MLPLISAVDKTIPISCPRVKATFAAAEKPVPVVGNPIVCPIENSGRKHPKHPKQAPWAANPLQNEQNGVRSSQQRRRMRSIVRYNVDGFESVRIAAVPLHEGAGYVTLQRRKTERAAGIVPDDKFDHPPAQPTFRVVQYQVAVTRHRFKPVADRGPSVPDRGAFQERL